MNCPHCHQEIEEEPIQYVNFITIKGEPQKLKDPQKIGGSHMKGISNGKLCEPIPVVIVEARTPAQTTCLIYCPTCQTPTKHTRTAGGEWVCGCGTVEEVTK